MNTNPAVAIRGLERAPARPVVGLAFLRRVAGTALRAIERVLERQRQRRALSNLSDHLLRDVGLTRQQATTEAQKPFWSL